MPDSELKDIEPVQCHQRHGPSLPSDSSLVSTPGPTSRIQPFREVTNGVLELDWVLVLVLLISNVFVRVWPDIPCWALPEDLRLVHDLCHQPMAGWPAAALLTAWGTHCMNGITPHVNWLYLSPCSRLPGSTVGLKVGFDPDLKREAVPSPT
jgi:hypothetical protein